MGPALIRDLEDSVAPNTWRAYRSDLADYSLWIDQEARKWREPESIADYMRCLETGSSYATITRRLTAIHKLLAIEALASRSPVFEDPTKHPLVSVTLQAIRNRLRTDQDQASPITAPRLVQILTAIDSATIAGTRDVALLLVGWYGALRRSELAGLRRPHVTHDPDGLVLRLTESKGSHESVYVPIARQPDSNWDPMGRLEAWLDVVEAHQPTSEAIWLRVTKGDTIVSPSSMSSAAINHLVQRRARAAGVVPADGFGNYSAHSLRAGFITEAKNRRIDEADIMRHTRHKSVQVMRRYDRTSGLWTRNATSGMGI